MIKQLTAKRRRPLTSIASIPRELATGANLLVRNLNVLRRKLPLTLAMIKHRQSQLLLHHAHLRVQSPPEAGDVDRLAGSHVGKRWHRKTNWSNDSWK